MHGCAPMCLHCGCVPQPGSAGEHVWTTQLLPDETAGPSVSQARSGWFVHECGWTWGGLEAGLTLSLMLLKADHPQASCDPAGRSQPCGDGENWSPKAAITAGRHLHRDTTKSRCVAVADPPKLGSRLKGTSTKPLPVPELPSPTAAQGEPGLGDKTPALPRNGSSGRALGRAQAHRGHGGSGFVPRWEATEERGAQPCSPISCLGASTHVVPQP